MTTRRHRDLSLALLLLLGTLVAVVRPAPARAASDGAPMLLGMNIGGVWREELDDFSSQLGRSPALWGLAWIPDHFVEQPPWAVGQLRHLHSRGVTGYVEWTTDDLDALADGRLDDRIRNLYGTISDFVSDGPGRSIVIAPLPEANLDEHTWGKDPVAYQRVFLRMRRLAAEAGLTREQVRFSFHMNGHSTPGRSYAQFYPGDEHVDLVAFARLNRGTGGPDGWRDQANVFGQPLEDMVEQIGLTKPIFVAQTGSVTAGGDRSAWLAEMFAELPKHPQVIGALYFNRNLAGGDFRIHEKAGGIPLDPTFRDGALSWSTPDQSQWLFDGSLDQWVANRGGAPATWPPTTADQPPASNPFGRDMAATPRVGAATPIANAVAISRSRFAPDDARHVVLSRSDRFPDALAGTPLLGEGPLLLTPSSSLDATVRAEIGRVVRPGSVVYLLGGTSALSPSIAQQLTDDGYEVRRLAGPDRFSTSRAVAEEVRALYPESGGTVLVARGYGTADSATAAWADSVTGGGFAAARRHPVVLSLSDTLSPDAAAIVDGADVTYLLGGRSALSDAVMADVAQRADLAIRVSGAARDATAVEVVTQLWGAATREGRFIVIDGYGAQGWAFGLPAAGLAAEFEAPLLPVRAGSVPGATADALTSCSFKRIATLAVGSSAVISDAAVAAVEAKDRSC